MPTHQVASPLLPHISSPTVSNPIRLMEHPYDLLTRTDLVSVQTISVEHHLKTNIPIPCDGNNDFVHISTVINPNPQWILSGYADQHREMKAIVQRLHQLVNETNEQEKRVERETINSANQLISKIWLAMKVGKNQKNGNRFIKCLNDLLNKQANHLLEDFKKSLHDKSRSLVEVGCIRMMVRYDDELKKLTESYLEKKVIEQSFEKMICAAYSEFNQMLKREILQQENGIHGDVSKVLDHHLEKLEDQLTSEAVYIGKDKENFTLLSSLLKRSELFCYCDTFGLPISTPTGSGKSTILPLLLTAHGYDKILVTQPRRLACNLLSTRVNDKVKKRISGWAVAGVRSKKDSNTQIIYLTDGLLRTELQLSEGNIFNLVEECKQGIVYFIDEVHERSINIDLCVAFLSRLLTQYDLEGKIKVIISSATLDPSFEKVFHHINYHSLKISIRPFYNVIVHKNSRENLFDLIEHLFKDIKRGEQILCFVKSTSDVYHSIELLDQLKKLPSYPLVESQSPLSQQKLIAEKQIFFLTTVAQTSLTFPALEYVIDTGIINMPIYDAQTDTTILTELPASDSTITQRIGRLTRTQDGEYFPLYNPHVERPDFTTPQIYQTELSDVDFALGKSSEEKDSLATFKQWLPDQPSQAIIVRAHDRLKKLGILNYNERFSDDGKAIAKLPDFGSLSMKISVYFGLTKEKCDQDMIRLAAILSVLNTTFILSQLSPQFKQEEEGDYMSLLTLMNAIIEKPNMIKNNELEDIDHLLRRALLRKWSYIARALLAGHNENLYVALKELNGRIHQYCRYNNVTQEETRKQIAKLDKATTLSQLRQPSIVIARDVLCTADVRKLSILSIIGSIQPVWLDNSLIRKFELTSKERIYFQENIRASDDFKAVSQHVCNMVDNKALELSGNAGQVFETERFVRQQLIRPHDWNLVDDDQLDRDKNLKMNVESIRKCLSMFFPLIWRFENEKQAIVRVMKDGIDNCKILVESRDKDNETIREEFDSFVKWLRKCVSIQHLHSDISPQRLQKPDAEIEERIRLVTDPERTRADLMQDVLYGTREIRMQVVAWIAVVEFDCKLEGGFIRDWIVGHRSSRPSNLDPKTWMTFNPKTGLPELDSNLVPADLDCHLSLDKYFDLEHFLDRMHTYKIKVKPFRQPWRYVLLFDEDAPTGPFTMDLIEPHIALAHDRIDFNLNNLYVKRGFTRELGQRIDLSEPPCSIQLDDIVEDIRKYQFRILRPIDKFMEERIVKMKRRGYKQIGEPFSIILTPPSKYRMVSVELSSYSPEYKRIQEKFREKLSDYYIVSIEEIKNDEIQKAYEAMKYLIAHECPNSNSNEMKLFHGTRTRNINSLLENGFDDRYFNIKGNYGHGAYLADDPSKSHEFTSLDDDVQIMLYCKAIMGNIDVIKGELNGDKAKASASIGYHSTKGLPGAGLPAEYIVYRNTQIMPHLKITYKKRK
ncbi:unnamed protein product [Rotaria magnacalcarata]|uniref:Poly [ADP-ribose] polymerase n=2 Tax=Rotaria magnacalcarata TaxID=392030 RepID=A0A819VDY4_9BILA|nr:unnamed protein product [Rotaria magnacalcarata]